MDTITITILEPAAEKELDKLESQKLIKIEKPKKVKKKSLQFGSMKGLGIHMADDFNAQMEGFNNSKNGIHKSKSERRAFYLSAPVMTDDVLKRHKEIKQWMNQWR